MIAAFSYYKAVAVRKKTLPLVSFKFWFCNQLVFSYGLTPNICVLAENGVVSC